MLTLLLLAQPMPAVAATNPNDRDRCFHVDLIIVNQYCRTSPTHTGAMKSTVTWYTSFWNVHMMPPWGVCRMPVFEHRGWCKTQPPFNCDGGYGVMSGDKLVISPKVMMLVTDYDFEYRNRQWFRPIDR